MEQFYNEITYFLDEFTPKYCGNAYCDNNYFWGDMDETDNPDIYAYAFRVPGATRGHVCIDKTTYKIVAVEVYNLEMIYCYTIPYELLTKKLEEKFVGTNWNELHNIPRK